MAILSEEDVLRTIFEKQTRKYWGWNNYNLEKNGRYVSREIQSSWQSFVYGVKIGKEIGDIFDNMKMTG